MGLHGPNDREGECDFGALRNGFEHEKVPHLKGVAGRWFTKQRTAAISTQSGMRTESFRAVLLWMTTFPS